MFYRHPALLWWCSPLAEFQLSLQSLKQPYYSHAFNPWYSIPHHLCLSKYKQQYYLEILYRCPALLWQHYPLMKVQLSLQNSDLPHWYHPCLSKFQCNITHSCNGAIFWWNSSFSYSSQTSQAHITLAFCNCNCNNAHSCDYAIYCYNFKFFCSTSTNYSFIVNPFSHTDWIWDCIPSSSHWSKYLI